MKRPLLLCAAVVPAVLVLGACEPFHAGAAATVGGSRISTTQLRGMVDRGVQVIPAGATSAPSREAIGRAGLTQLIQLQVLEDLAASRQVTVGAQQVDALLTTASKQGDLNAAFAQQGVAPQDIRLRAQVAAYEQAIATSLTTDTSKQAAELTAAYKTVSSSEGIHVNPRFGSWVAGGGADGLGDVEPADSGDLSTPAPGGSASPSVGAGLTP